MAVRAHLGRLGVDGGEAGLVDDDRTDRERRCRLLSDDAQELAVTAMIAPTATEAIWLATPYLGMRPRKLVRRLAEKALRAGGSSSGAARMALVIASMSAATRAQDAQRVEVRPQQTAARASTTPRPGRAPPGSGRARRRASSPSKGVPSRAITH